MREEYVIAAFSRTSNQTVREINLQMNNPQVVDLAMATRLSESLALRLNRNQHLQATDWVAKPAWTQVGIETLRGR